MLIKNQRSYRSRYIKINSEDEGASLVAQMVRNPAAMQETRVWFLGLDIPLEKEMAIHSSILVWRIPWKEEPGRLQSTGSQESDMTERLHFHFLGLNHGVLQHLEDLVKLCELAKSPRPQVVERHTHDCRHYRELDTWNLFFWLQCLVWQRE